MPVAIVAAGAIFYAGMVAIKSPTDRLDRVHRGPLVETIAAPKISTNVIVKGYGTVRPTEEIDIVFMILEDMCFGKMHFSLAWIESI